MQHPPSHPCPADPGSQILELLLDMNETTRLPSNLRFDLRDLSAADTSLPKLEVEADPEAIQRRLQELRTDMVNGVITPEEFAQLSERLHGPQTIITNRTLTGLEAKVPHSTQVPDPAPEGLLLGDNAPGYMSPAHEDEYLLGTDLALADPNYDPNAHDGRPLRRNSNRHMPSEKELTIQNPDSVYNWLRKNQPQVFLQDRDPAHPENASEKSLARPANTGRGKRPSAVASSTPAPKGEQDDDDMGFIPESGTAGGKGRKGKGEDDSAYRPKGGSSRPTKRKREDGDPVGKGGRKKNRASAAGAAT
jgi:hypothetical protein